MNDMGHIKRSILQSLKAQLPRDVGDPAAAVLQLWNPSQTTVSLRDENSKFSKTTLTCTSETESVEKDPHSATFVPLGPSIFTLPTGQQHSNSPISFVGDYFTESKFAACVLSAHESANSITVLLKKKFMREK
jgi:hypothetical protein